ncbi:MAG: DUF261 family protein, partial [Planctomycetota bacterium]
MNDAIQRWGCYFMSILFLCNKYKNVELSCPSILDVYKIAVDGGWMDEECFIRNPEALFDFMGLNVYFYDRHDLPT